MYDLDLLNHKIIVPHEFQNYFNNQKKNFINELVKLIPMKRMANKSDIKNTIDFLIDEKQKFITGQNIIIDGGRTII